MPKVSPYGLRIKERGEILLRFNDPEGGVEFDVPARPLTKMQTLAAIEEANGLTTRYVTGWGEKDSKGYVEPQALPPVGGEPVFASSSTFTLACMIVHAQTEHDASERYTPEELVSFMASDVLLAQFEDAAEKIQPPKEKKADPLAQKGSEAA